MSFTRPTILELLARVKGDFTSKLSLVGIVLRRSMVTIFSAVVAGAAHLLHGHMDFLAKQLFPDTSEDEFFLRQASLFGFSQNAPTNAHAAVVFTGTDGTPIPAGTLLTVDSNEYSLDVEVTPSGGVVLGQITSVEAGADQTLSEDAVLTFESPISGIDSTAIVNESTIDGTDQETIEELRVRFLERLASPAHGGSSADYIEWAKEVAGVTRVWVYPMALGPGTVLIRFVRDNDVDPIPSVGEVAVVQAYIDARKPAHANVTVAAPTADTLAVTFSEIVPDNSDMRTAIELSILDLALRVATPRDSSDADSGTILLSKLRTAIGDTPGLDDYTMTIPSANHVSASGYLVTAVTPTFL